jgi:predicted NBD/HSP70 family sugar kinase
VVVENDANAAAWAETRFGAGHGQPYTVTVTITVGTGLGGGVVLGGELLRGAFGAAAEVGHMNLVPDGRPCGCGNAGCWEQYASGRALVTEARQRAARSPRLGRPAARVRPCVLRGRRGMAWSWHGGSGRDLGPAGVHHRRWRV